MILLRRLRVGALKRLREVDIWFPRQGSILVEGQNESGKSSLFEALFFALYGVALVGEETRASLDDLVPHDAAQAEVELWLATADAELRVTRRVRPGQGGRTQQEARLVVTRPGVPGARSEELHSPRAVNERILSELGGLDGDALRNSCFMEQKALDRLEQLSREQRDRAVARLLGLDRLLRIERELRPTGDDARALDRLSAELELAESHHAAERAERERRAAGQALHAARIRQLLAERDRPPGDNDAPSLSELNGERGELERRIERAGRTQDLLAALDAIQPLAQAAHEATDRRARTQAERDTLDARERDELPPLVARLAALDALGGDASALDRLRLAIAVAEREREAATALAEERRALAGAEAAAAREEDAARAATAQGQRRATLERWIALKTLDERAGDDGAAPALTRERDELAAQAASARGAARRLALGAGVALVVALVSLTGALAARLGALLPVAALALVVALVAGWAWRGRQANATRLATRRAEVERRLTQAIARREAAESFAAERAQLPAVEVALRVAGQAVPASVEAARDLLATLEPPSEAQANAHTVEAARAKVARCAERVAQAERAVALAHEERQQNAPETGALDGEGVSAWLASARAERERRASELGVQAAALGVGAGPEARIAARAVTQRELDRLREQLARRPALDAALDAQAGEAERRRSALADALARVAGEAQAHGVASPTAPDDATLPALLARRETLRAALTAERDRQDAPGAREALARLEERARQATSATVEAETRRAALQAQLREALAAQGVTCQGDEPLDALVTRWPPLADAQADEADALAARFEAARERESEARGRAAQEAKRYLDAYHVTPETLDAGVCAARLAEARRARRQREIAAELARDARARIAQRVLPETAAHMRALLPELTAGRYHDVELVNEEGGADLRIRVWDAVAGRYVAKNLFSGGARDQFSLALRLAFALATLPKELGALPGFIFLDEPLSSFDDERSQALVRTLTQGMVGRRFPQTVLISHSRSIPRDAFAYHLRLADGQVESSDLPDATAARASWQAEPAMVTPAPIR